MPKCPRSRRPNRPPARLPAPRATPPGGAGRPARYPIWTASIPISRARSSTRSSPARRRADGCPEKRSSELLAAAGVPTIASATVDNAEEAARAAAQLGFPVALKAAGPQLVHKTDAGGVRLGLRSEDEVADAYRSMATSHRRTDDRRDHSTDGGAWRGNDRRHGRPRAVRSARDVRHGRDRDRVARRPVLPNPARHRPRRRRVGPFAARLTAAVRVPRLAARRRAARSRTRSSGSPGWPATCRTSRNSTSTRSLSRPRASSLSTPERRWRRCRVGLGIARHETPKPVPNQSTWNTPSADKASADHPLTLRNRHRLRTGNEHLGGSVGNAVTTPEPVSFRHVLVPLDGSERGSCVANRSPLAARFGADIHTVSAAVDHADAARLRLGATSALGGDAAANDRVHVVVSEDPVDVIDRQRDELGSAVVCLATRDGDGFRAPSSVRSRERSSDDREIR